MKNPTCQNHEPWFGEWRDPVFVGGMSALTWVERQIMVELCSPWGRASDTIVKLYSGEKRYA